mgnify:CR=1 FL=1
MKIALLAAQILINVYHVIMNSIEFCLVISSVSAFRVILKQPYITFKPFVNVIKILFLECD